MAQAGDIPTQTDVLVLGAGMAGHCAAIAAAEAGADVLFLEKAARPRGSSAMAGGVFLFTGTDLQKAAGQADSLAALRQDLLEAGKHKNDPELVELYVQSQLETYEFLRGHGVTFHLPLPNPPPSRGRIILAPGGRSRPCTRPHSPIPESTFSPMPPAGGCTGRRKPAGWTGRSCPMGVARSGSAWPVAWCSPPAASRAAANEGSDFILGTDMSHRGTLPLNTSGGQISAGQPGLAGGGLNLVEAVRQLFGEAGERQIADPRCHEGIDWRQPGMAGGLGKGHAL